MSVKVCHLTSVHGPHDVRIFQKMCRSLAEAGFDVYLVVANAQSEERDGVKIIGVEVPFSGRLSRMRKTAEAVYEKARDVNGSVYHIHDPELIPYGLRLQRSGKKVIFDSHEDTPKAILGKTWLGPLLVRKLISVVYNAYEKAQVRKLSGLISVTEAITAKFLHPNSLTVHNYPRLDFFDRAESGVLPDLPERVRLVHHGGLTEMRGIHCMVQAMKHLDDEYRLILMGPWETEAYRDRCRKTEGWERVTYLGNLDIVTCFAVLKRCHLGLVLLRPFPSYRASLPIKAFEYMGVPLPMLMSDFPFWREEFGPYAHFADPENPEDIASAVRRIRALGEGEDRRIRKVSAEILATKTWKAEAKKLVDYYKTLEPTTDAA